MSPDTPANFYDFNGDVISVPLISVTAWVVALRAELKSAHIKFMDTEEVVRRILKTPEGYPKEAILAHLEEVLMQTKSHYGIGETVQ